jgi:hypothetical protein
MHLAESNMGRKVLIELEMPGDLKGFRLPPGLNKRLQDLLDKKYGQGKLSSRERREAEGLVDVSEFLS